MDGRTKLKTPPPPIIVNKPQKKRNFRRLHKKHPPIFHKISLLLNNWFSQPVIENKRR